MNWKKKLARFIDWAITAFFIVGVSASALEEWIVDKDKETALLLAALLVLVLVQQWKINRDREKIEELKNLGKQNENGRKRFR